MGIMQTEAVKSLIQLYDRGAQLNWLGVAGDSVSRWLTTPELMSMEKELDFNSQNYLPMNLKEPKLARECFLYCSHGDQKLKDYTGRESISLHILQVNAAGDKCRVIWENGEPNRSPLEISIHLTCHAARGVGAGSVVYHCQPLNTLALAAMVEKEKDLMRELVKGFAAIISILPDGIAVIPWMMKRPLRIGETMTQEMYDTMEQFMCSIREQISYQEALVLRGEGVICASRHEREVYSIINSIERAATVRLHMLAAGAK